MAARTGGSERSSHSTEDPDVIDLSDRIQPFEGTAREEFSLSPTHQLGYRSSSSINLLESSDIVQVDTNANEPEAATICLGNNPCQLQFKDDESDVSSVSSAKSEKSSGSREGPTSASQVSDITTHESGGNVMSPTQSPPLQTMDRVGEYDSYDPFRIPSAVFERSRSITPLEWSIASNESLFSIHVGNNSFSRDHMLMLGDLGKSGELTKSDELFMFNTPPAIINTKETEMQSDGYEEDPRRVLKDKEGLIAEDLSEGSMPPPAVSWNSSSKSRHSDRSQSSSDSFAFPIKKKSACPSCYCSNCSRAFCYCLRPRCYLTWPSCCCWNCSRAFCYCWNDSRKGFCYHTSNTLADEEAHGESMPADAKRKHQNTQGTAVSPNSTAKSWFPCCSCSSCYKWNCCSCSSCYKWSFCSYSSCYKWKCCSCSCYKWSFCSCSSCCKWSWCSCPSCWNCCSCPFRHCCHFQRCCHLRCCHFCRCC